MKTIHQICNLHIFLQLSFICFMILSTLIITLTFCFRQLNLSNFLQTYVPLPINATTVNISSINHDTIDKRVNLIRLNKSNN